MKKRRIWMLTHYFYYPIFSKNLVRPRNCLTEAKKSISSPQANSLVREEAQDEFF